MRKLESSRRVGRTQQPLVWETDYVAAEQNLETIGFFSARYTRPSIRNEKDLSKIVNLSEEDVWRSCQRRNTDSRMRRT